MYSYLIAKKQPHQTIERGLQMKALANYQRAVNYLPKIFKAANERYFNNELETPTITIQSSCSSYGHITTSKVWGSVDSQGESHSTYEINISADYLTRDIIDVVSTLEHEMVHLYCLQNNIRDTSNHGVYHNSTFKHLAETKTHLIIERHPKYGWTITSPSEETINFCIEYGFSDITIGRNTGYSFTGIGGNKSGDSGNGGDKTPKVRKPSSTRKYICPKCGSSFRATKNLNVLCMDCNTQFVLAE